MLHKSIYEAIFEDGVAYERFMGRWSALTGQQFIKWLQVAPRVRWLEVGCGTGAFTKVILSHGDPQSVTAVDPSAAYIEFAKSRVVDPRVELKLGDATSIDACDGEFNVAAAALVLSFIPDQKRAVEEMRRVVQPGGMVAAYVWDFAGGGNVSQHLMNAIREIEPDAADVSYGFEFESTAPRALAGVFKSAGLVEVETVSLNINANFDNFEDYWSSNTSFKSPTSQVCGTLTPTQREAVRATLRRTLPMSADGRITVAARASAVRGIVAKR